MLRLITLSLALAFMLALNQAARSQSGQPPGPSGGSTQGDARADLDWRELSGAEREQALELLIAQTGSNYEKISTWTGTYAVHKEEYWSESAMRGPFESEGKRAQAVIKESQLSFRFAIDVQSESTFRDYVRVRHRMLSTDPARTPVQMANDYGPLGQRSVVTAKDYLYIQPGLFRNKLGITALGLVGTFPEAQGKRWAYRVPPERARNQDHGDLMNPLFFFHCNSLEPFHEDLRRDLSMLRGDKGPKLKTRMEAALTLSESTREGVAWCRTRLRIGGRDGFATVFTSIWSQEAGFNPVSSSVAFEVGAKMENQSLMDWRWRKVDGIFVPQYVKEAFYDPSRGGLNTYLRIAELKDCALNKPIPASTFTIKALGLKEGELLADETDQTVYVVDGNGGTTKLARFNEVYVPPDKRRTAAIRWTLSLSALVLLMAAAALFVHKRMGRSRGGHPASAAS